ncbi:MAG TPA: lysophospholipid acyltransferase family protein [Burkholderiaceae bacterium]|jgi:1-acyl-sn-glycerol-3-phosphate acyltransferase|nr:lysophospholipid acyltransferase family protein [Burkholderiaceae bacterium]
MQALRSLLFLLFMTVTVIPYALLCLLWAPLPLHRRYALTVGWPRLVMAALRSLCGLRWQVLGHEHLPDGPAIILSKHQSTWETFFYPTYMPREVCYVFKRELLYLPFFGWGLALLDMIHIDRRRGRDAFESMVAQGVQKLAQGRWIIIFPEGTRTPVGSQGRYKTGGARLAVRTNTPVVPIAVNSGEFWPKKKFIKRPGTITVSIGKPILPAGKTAEQLNDEVEHWIEREMRRISPHAYNTEAARNEAYS